MPTKQRPRRHQKNAQRRPRQVTRDGRQQGSISCAKLRPRHLAAENLELVTQHEQLDVFHMKAAAAPNERTKQSPNSKVDEREDHAPILPALTQPRGDTNGGTLQAAAGAELVPRAERFADCAAHATSVGHVGRRERGGEVRIDGLLVCLAAFREFRLTAAGHLNPGGAPIVLVVAPLDQARGLEAVDDSCDSALGDLQKVGDVAHQEAPLRGLGEAPATAAIASAAAGSAHHQHHPDARRASDL